MDPTRFRYLTGCFALAFASLGAHAQTLSADTPVLASPDPAARAVANLRAGAAAKILKRQGFSLEIESGAAKGWVRISTVKLATPAAPGAIDTGRLDAGNIVATAILDRLLHHAVTLNIRGNSYR